MPLLGHDMEDRNDVFQRLKPVCVSLSQAALASNTTGHNAKEITIRIVDLQHCLSAIVTKRNLLDEKLADYVFFPLSQVLKNSQNASIRTLELTFQCLAILIAQGWRSRIPAPLAGQIVILCTLMAEKKPSGLASNETTSELQSHVFSTLTALFNTLDPSSVAQQELVKESNIPQLGQMISTMLEGVADGLSVECQLAATAALSSFMENVATIDIIAGFLPGVVSKLTKILTPQTNQRRNHKVLIRTLAILRNIFAASLSSEPKLSTRREGSQVRSTESFSNVIDETWLETAATQLKPAVASILRLRSHDREDVKDALAQFCFVIVKDCGVTLANCASAALETLLILSSEDGQDSIAFRLEMAVVAFPRLSSQLQDTLRDWLLSLPTQMQASDEQGKLQRLKQIGIAHAILVTSGVDTTFIDAMVADALRDSVVVTLQSSRVGATIANNARPVQALDVVVTDQAVKTEFRLPLASYRGQADVMIGIKHLLGSMSATSSSTTFVSALNRTFRQANGDTQLATFWLLLEHNQASFNARRDMDGFLDFDDGTSPGLQEQLEDVYSFALDLLTGSSQDSLDTQFQSLALRALALRAQASGRDFRYELVDALYPVLHTLATPDQQLQQDSIVALNIFAKSCGYGAVKDLIVENVDYLTNTVALRLNAFDISPQAPQVLLMMVRLAGPSLLPYLEDTIGSIFAALEDYHGYPLLVELLFKVLGVIAEEGVKTPFLATTQQKRIEKCEARDDRWKPLPLSDLAEYLRDVAADDDDFAAAEDQRGNTHPKRPWSDDSGAAPELASEVGEYESQEEIPSSEERQVDAPESKPPAPKTYDLLFKISELTQHYLPSASAALRTSLLALIKTTIPAIAQHENTFLPLINTLWPEIVSRLDDDESQVVAGALEIIGLLCEFAGEFMRSRLLQVWPTLTEIHQATLREILQLVQPKHDHQGKSNSTTLVPVTTAVQKAMARLQSTSVEYVDTPTKLLWNSLVSAINSAVQHASLPPDTFDAALNMMEPCIDEARVQEAFERQNADAVWLLRVRNGTISLSPQPPTFHASPKWTLASFPVR